MVVTLKGKNGSILARSFTTGPYGEPFLDQDRKNIVVPFDSITDVREITISFEGGTFGQVRSLSVEGVPSKSIEYSHYPLITSAFVQRSANKIGNYRTWPKILTF